MRPPLSSELHVWIADLDATRGGVQSYCASLVRALVELGEADNVRVISRAPSPKTWERVQVFGGTSGGRAEFAARLGAFTFGRRPRCIWATHINFAPFAIGLGAVVGARVGVSLHGIEAWDVRGMKGAALRRADAVFPVSDFTASRVDAALLSKSVVTGNTVDPARFTPGPKSAALLERYGLTEQHRVLLTVARLERSEAYKGYHQVLDALPELLRRHPETRFLLVGRGDELPLLQARAHALGVSEHVIFAGYVPGAELADHYRLADAFVMPSRGEGFGIVYLEAMACGVPVIASSADAGKETLDEGRLGALVAPEDKSALVDACARVLRKEGEPRLMFEPHALRAAALDRFGPAAFRMRVAAALEQLRGSELSG